MAPNYYVFIISNNPSFKCICIQYKSGNTGKLFGLYNLQLKKRVYNFSNCLFKKKKKLIVVALLRDTAEPGVVIFLSLSML